MEGWGGDINHEGWGGLKCREGWGGTRSELREKINRNFKNTLKYLKGKEGVGG